MTGARPFRVIDTGVRGARANIAFDQALIEAHKEGLIPDTIRFLRFTPSALVGRHQYLAEEVRLDWCQAHGIEVARRITGGGVIVMESGILGWELVFARDRFGAANLAELAAWICTAAAEGLATLGIPARYRPRNDIEVEGRKIGGTGGFFDGGTIFYQGTLLVDCDPAAMMQALTVHDAKRAKHGLAEAAARMTTLRTILGTDLPALDAIQAALIDGFGRGLGIDVASGTIMDVEEEFARRLHDEEIGTNEFVDGIAPFGGPDVVNASRTLPGGTIRVDLKLEGPGRASIGQALFTGDFFVTPPRLVYDLEAALKGVSVARAAAETERFLTAAKAEILSIPLTEFAATVAEAVHKAETAWPRN